MSLGQIFKSSDADGQTGIFCEDILNDFNRITETANESRVVCRVESIRNRRRKERIFEFFFLIVSATD